MAIFFFVVLAPIPTKYYKHAIMNHRDTTIVMFFLLAGLILSLIVLIILCAVLFIRVKKETRHHTQRSDISKSMKLKNVE